MGKHFFLLITLLAVSSGFSYTPIFKDFCTNLSEMTLNFNVSGINTSYANLTEFPKEILEIFNAKIHNNSDFSLMMKSFDNMTLSAEIYYNKTECFKGSIFFSNSSISYIKLDADPLKSTSNDHVYFHAELINLEQIINEWIIISQNATNKDPLSVIFLGVRSFGTVVFGLLMNDFYVKPLGGIIKVFNFLKVLPQLSVSKELISSGLKGLNSTMSAIP